MLKTINPLFLAHSHNEREAIFVSFAKDVFITSTMITGGTGRSHNRHHTRWCTHTFAKCKDGKKKSHTVCYSTVLQVSPSNKLNFTNLLT